jgi:hypothetical protein
METRHSERVETSLPVILHALDGTRIPGVVRNVGTKGLFVKTNRSLDVDSEVTVTLDLSRDRGAMRQRIEGVVVHSRDEGIGLYTSDLDDAVRGSLMKSLPLSGNNKGPCVWYVTQAVA